MAYMLDLNSSANALLFTTPINQAGRRHKLSWLETE